MFKNQLAKAFSFVFTVGFLFTRTPTFAQELPADLSPGTPGSGGRIIAPKGQVPPPAPRLSGGVLQRGHCVVMSTDNDPGFEVPQFLPVHAVHRNVSSLDDMTKRLASLPAQSVSTLVWSGHGSSEGGVSTKNPMTHLSYKNLTSDHIKLIKSKFKPWATIVLIGCHCGINNDLVNLAKACDCRVIANTGKVNTENSGEGVWVQFEPPKIVKDARGETLTLFNNILSNGENKSCSENNVVDVMIANGITFTLCKDAKIRARLPDGDWSIISAPPDKPVIGIAKYKNELYALLDNHKCVKRAGDGWIKVGDDILLLDYEGDDRLIAWQNNPNFMEINSQRTGFEYRHLVGPKKGKGPGK
jgi:hypothetical protein